MVAVTAVIVLVAVAGVEGLAVVVVLAVWDVANQALNYGESTRKCCSCVQAVKMRKSYSPFMVKFC